ncbi:endocuticle structural glycoprotein SgAbd-3-like [Contarinia nasturtii]|uniref:endocuticle structural glycoprotein SgAbd-3-like n=1 Tax=Contarinia nasturtii TaxID=265458 RepID=UPI0012D48A6D|nr:endocuticle structural glycoprotein SgAbd-3-like [Contarinia nasturtii]
MNVKIIFIVALLVAVAAAGVSRSAKEPESESEIQIEEEKPEEIVEDHEETEVKHKPDLSAHKPDKIAVIKSKTQTSDNDGNYQYQFESSNGIVSNEGGVAGQIVQGSTTWIAKNGEPLAISFVADENGYRPMGYHLPTSPPIPKSIQRALAYLATKKPDSNDY